MPRELASEPVRDVVTTWRRSRRWWWVFVGLIIVLIGSGCGSTSTDESTAPSDVESTQSTSTTAPDGSTTQTTQAPTDQGESETSEQTSDSEPPSVVDFDDAMIEQAIADAAATPLEDIAPPGRNVVATSLMIEEFGSVGFDLTGLEIVVYPLNRSASFLLMVTNDSTALISDDDGMELIVTQLLGSPIVTEFDIKQLVFQHSSVDDVGPFVVTFAAALSDLQEALDTGVDIFDRVAVQLERT